MKKACSLIIVIMFLVGCYLPSTNYTELVKGKIEAQVLSNKTILITCVTNKKPVTAEVYANGVKQYSFADSTVLLPPEARLFNVIFDDGRYLQIPAEEEKIPGIELLGIKINANFKYTSDTYKARLEILK